jgi:adenine-specific DNA-methyltransferase
MLSEIFNTQNRFLFSKSQSDKKKLGQFFTGTAVSEYMASLIDLDITARTSIRILDAGAGMGILSAAASLECLEKGVREIHVEAFELDPQAIEYLKATYELLVDFFLSKDAIFTYHIHNLDFVLNPPHQIGIEEKFDLSVINPPYFKYNTKDSPYCKATLSLYKGNPNIYASFMAICLESLKPNGQLIVIVPRSFTNGLYFKHFRNYMLNNSSIELIHIFAKRNKVFKNDDVLQENIICNFIKKEQSSAVVISSSNSIVDVEKSSKNIYSRNLIIDSSNEQNLIRIPESKEQFDILELAEKLPTTFSEAGYFISTGPVVEFRTREFHTTESNSAVPVIRPHNFSDSQIIWDGKHKKDIAFQLKGEFKSHLVESRTYIILKRITSKDETKRLVANIYLPNKHQSIGISNKLNYLGLKNEEFSIEEATGLSSFFNSTFMDKYFRSISGNTQVNSNEVRVLKFLERKTIKLLGEKILKSNNNSQKIIDKLVLDIIKAN